MAETDSQSAQFLSIQAQDFIEDNGLEYNPTFAFEIPEHSSSGLH